MLLGLNTCHSLSKTIPRSVTPRLATMKTKNLTKMYDTRYASISPNRLQRKDIASVTPRKTQLR